MKKLYIVFAILVISLGCNKLTPAPTPTEDVVVKVTYTLDTSIGETMTKAGTSELWRKFYAKISTGELVASTYSLTFVEKTSGVTYKFSGTWGKDELITIKTGEYTVTGYSTAEGSYIQDKVSLSFNTDITISTTHTEITLPAKYSCFLLAFAKSDIKSLTNYIVYSYLGGTSSKTIDFYTFEDHYYAFSKILYNTEFPTHCYIEGTRESNAKFYIYTNQLNFQYGKYYFYTDVSSLYSIPEMEEGE